MFIPFKNGTPPPIKQPWGLLIRGQPYTITNIDPKAFNRTNPEHGLFVSFPLQKHGEETPRKPSMLNPRKKGVSKGKGQTNTSMPTISSILWWLEARRPQVCGRLGLSRCLAVCMARLASDKLMEDHSGLACRHVLRVNAASKIRTWKI